MRRWIYVLATACPLVWSNVALAAAPATDSSVGDRNDKASQRKEAMAVNKKPKPKGGATKNSTPAHVTHTVIQANPGFKIAENEGPRPQDRIFFQYNYFDAVRPQVFFGANASAGFQQTNFIVEPPFTVNGSGAMGGIFGGVLLPVPNTSLLFGPRFGWQGGNLTGSIVAPPASPFTYRVTTNSMFYQEAMVRFAIPSFRDSIPPGAPPVSISESPNMIFPFVTVGVGIAEVHTTTKGTLGAFSVTDGGYNPGITFTTGIGVPITRELVGFEKTFLGGNAEIFVQWRGTTTLASVNIPGAVPQGVWIQGVDVGLQIHY